MPGSYDPLADFYNRGWGDDYHAQIMNVLDRLLLKSLPAGAVILDVGCGTGRVAAQLTGRGFGVIGIDESALMLEHARGNAPEALFLEASAAGFILPRPVDAAISTFESLNHLLEPGDLRGCFQSVAAGGARALIFDLNQEPAFERFWNGEFVTEREGIVCRMRSVYDAGTRMATCSLLLQEKRFELRQRFHPEADVLQMLGEAGFTAVHVFDAARDLGMRGDVALARTFYQCLR